MIHFEKARAKRRLTEVALLCIQEDFFWGFDLELTWYVGISTGSCSVMASETKGAVHNLIKKVSNNKYCSCNNYILNNLLAKFLKVTSCHNAFVIMRKVVSFSNASKKRHTVFEEELEGLVVLRVWEIRWVEKHYRHLQFQGDNLVKIRNALERITSWEDNKVASDV